MSVPILRESIETISNPLISDAFSRVASEIVPLEIELDFHRFTKKYIRDLLKCLPSSTDKVVKLCVVKSPSGAPLLLVEHGDKMYALAGRVSRKEFVKEQHGRGA